MKSAKKNLTNFFAEKMKKQGVTKRRRTGSKPQQKKKSVASLLTPEIKFLDSAYSGTIPAPTDGSGGEADPATLLSLSSIAQGDGESTRDGKKCVVSSAFVSGTIYCPPQINQTAVDTSATVYIALVMDTQTNEAQLASEDVYVNPGGIAATAATPLRNLKYTSRFRVLDRFEVATPQAVIAYDGTNMETGGFQVPFKLSWKGQMPVTFSDTGGIIADVVDNSLHVIAYCSNVTQALSLNYNARVRFQG